MPLNSPAYDLEALRSLFPHVKHTTFLNHAGASPLSAPVKQAMTEAIDFTSGEAPGFWGEKSTALDKSLHSKLGQLINAAPDEIALVQNTSTALNYAALMLPARPGQNIIVCDKEFPSNVVPWMNLARRRGLELRVVPPEFGGLTVNRLAEHADENTLMVAVSSVEFLTGYRADLSALGAFCRARGIYLAVDGIQSLGHIPLDVQAANVDFLAAGALKSLMGPTGIGFLYVRREVAEAVNSPFAGGSSINYGPVWCNYNLDFREAAGRFELGTSNWIGLVGFETSVSILLDLGIANVDAWTTHLSNVLLDDLARRRYQALTPRDPACHGPIVTFAVPGDVKEMCQRLTDAGVMTAIREGYLRVSCHCYNTVEEMLRVGEVLGDSGG